MKRTRMILLLVILVLALPLPLYSADKLQLADCIDIALKNSPLYKGSRIDVSTTEERIKEARGRFFPEINLDGSYRKLNQPAPYIPAQDLHTPARFSDEVTSWNVNMRLPLFLGGRLLNSLEASKILREIKKQNLRLTKEELIANVTNAFNRVLELKKFLKARQDTLRAFEKYRNETELMFKSGRIARVDLLRVDVLLASERQKLISAREALTRAVETLSFFMGVTVESPDTIEGELPEDIKVDSSGVDELLKQRPDIMALRASIDRAERAIKITRAAHLPQVYLTGQYGRSYGEGLNDDEELWNVGVVARINIFDGGIIRSRVSQARLQKERLETSLKQAVLRARLQVQTALSQLKEARQKLSVAKEALLQAEESLRIERLKYSSGASTITDVLLAQSALSDAQARYYEALFDLNAAVVSFRKATGIIEKYTANPGGDND